MLPRTMTDCIIGSRESLVGLTFKETDENSGKIKWFGRPPVSDPEYTIVGERVDQGKTVFVVRYDGRSDETEIYMRDHLQDVLMAERPDFENS